MMHLTPIQEFYHGQSILITGATGFCGKVLLAKLLRSCPGIGSIYIIIRPKKGKEVHKRLQTLLQELVFQNSTGETIKEVNKVVALSGDMSIPGLGLSDEDRKLICKEVSIVFHAAATIKFNENLKVALQTNVVGTQEMANLCKEMPRLKTLIYVSTAYSNCYLEEIDEKLYPRAADPEGLAKLTQLLSADDFNTLETSLLGKWPNTYTFSKALAEHVINEYRCILPVAIFRPSIMISTLKEPVPGWLDNVNGPTLGALGASLGMIRCGHLGKNKVADFIPADTTVNALIAAAWETGCTAREEPTKIYNLVSGAQKPFTWGEYLYTCRDHTMTYPSSKAIWYMFGIMTSNRALYLFFSFFMEFIPACLMDIIPTITKGKHRNVDIYLRSGRFVKIVSYFANREWKFIDNNVQLLLKKMSPADQGIFSFDLSDLNWRDYFANYMFGLRTFILKEDPKTLPAARRRYKILFAVHLVTSAVFLYLFYLLLRFIITSLWIRASDMYISLFAIG